MKVLVSALLLVSVACVFGSPEERLQNAEAIDPFFVVNRDTRILLSTRNTRRRPEQITFQSALSLRNSDFNANRPTRVLIHGWWEDETSDINTDTSAELLEYYDFNVLLIDWSEGSRSINYAAAANRVSRVGNFIAEQLDFMHQNGFLDYNRLAVIGFSLGAHIAGFTGKNTRRGRVPYIVGLDPAGPLFSVRNPATRLDRSDGAFVEAIHTNGPIGLVGYGIGAAIADADFFPNGGRSQPGCLTMVCSHMRGVDFYVESIGRNRFQSFRCPTADNISARQCTLSPPEWMGGDGLNFLKTGRGSYFLETRGFRPFSTGPART